MLADHFQQILSSRPTVSWISRVRSQTRKYSTRTCTVSAPLISVIQQLLSAELDRVVRDELIMHQSWTRDFRLVEDGLSSADG